MPYSEILFCAQVFLSLEHCALGGGRAFMFSSAMQEHETHETQEMHDTYETDETRQYDISYLFAPEHLRFFVFGFEPHALFLSLASFVSRGAHASLQVIVFIYNEIIISFRAFSCILN